MLDDDPNDDYKMHYGPDRDDVPGWWFVFSVLIGLVLIALTLMFVWH